jgi:hypothetical protein
MNSAGYSEGSCRHSPIGHWICYIVEKCKERKMVVSCCVVNLSFVKVTASGSLLVTYFVCVGRVSILCYERKFTVLCQLNYASQEFSMWLQSVHTIPFFT